MNDAPDVLFAFSCERAYTVQRAGQSELGLVKHKIPRRALILSVHQSIFMFMDDFTVTPTHSFQRVNVVGTSGSGKSTFSRRLAEILAAPHIELDALFWGPGWQPRSDEEFFPLVAQAIAGERWILDGNYSRTMPQKWARVDCVIWLDLPFWQTVWRITNRCVRRSLSQEEIWEGTGNRESLRSTFLSRDSVVLWAMQTHFKNRRTYSAFMRDEQFAHIPFFHVRTARAADELLEQFRGGGRKH